MPRALRTIAGEIEADWKTVQSSYAWQYVKAMRHLANITDTYYADSAADVVRYFLANAGTWRGETAKHIKAELNQMLKGAK
jgi:hypothetical protein